MKVRLAPRANLDLEEIGDWIALDNRPAARQFIKSIRWFCSTLKQFPGRYPVDEQSNLRKAPHGAYFIFYRTTAEEVQIVRVVHSARDQAAIFGSDEV
jgi:toxin ParE1/3/4